MTPKLFVCHHGGKGESQVRSAPCIACLVFDLVTQDYDSATTFDGTDRPCLHDDEVKAGSKTEVDEV